MRETGAEEKYVRILQDMNEDSKTVVRCLVGVTDGLKVGITSGIGSVPSCLQG